LVKVEDLTIPRSEYLTVLGKYLTANSGQRFPILSASAITGTLSNSTITDPVKAVGCRRLSINLTVQALTGSTSPSILVHFLGLDPMEPSNSADFGDLPSSGDNPNPAIVDIDLTQNSPITSAPTTLRFDIAESGTLTVTRNDTPSYMLGGGMNVPTAWQVRIMVRGSSATASIVGSYELA
jgi:hypothetical protein